MDALLASFLIQSSLAGVFLVALWGIAFAYRRPLHRALAIGWTIYLLHLLASLTAAWFGRQAPSATTQWPTATVQLVSVAGSCLFWYVAIRLLADRQTSTSLPRRASLVAVGLVSSLLVASIVSGRILHQPGSGPLGILYPLPYLGLAAYAWWEGTRTPAHRRELIWLGIAFALFVARLLLVQTVIMPESTFAGAGLPRLLAVATVQLVQSVAVGVISISVAVVYERGAVLEQAERLLQTELRLRRSQQLELLGRMAAGIAHDFNNVLTAVSASATLAGHSLHDPDEARKELQAVDDAVERATRLTRQLLSFANPVPAGAPLTCVADVVQRNAAMLSRLAGATIALSVAAEPSTAQVALDRTQLEQILLNLVVNSRDAMSGAGTIAIEVSDVRISHPRRLNEGTLPVGHYVCLSVQDSGKGIPADVLPRILEPFFTTKSSNGGTGIGLATVHQIVVAAHGELAIHSTVDVGTRIEVYLPLASDSRPPVV